MVGITAEFEKDTSSGVREHQQEFFYCPAGRAFFSSTLALCSIMALIMAGLIAGVVAGDNGRNGYWLAFPPTSTHWKYGILPVEKEETEKQQVAAIVNLCVIIKLVLKLMFTG